MEDIILKELKGCYDFFATEYNNNVLSKGYGLVKDKSCFADNVSSIASVGFGFCAIVSGVKRKFMTYEEGYFRADKTLDTFLNMKNVHGFYYHFVDMETTERVWNSEVSIIDTALLVAGMITAGEFFGGGIKEKAEKIYRQIDWNWYRDKTQNRFYMGYTDENGFSGHWDWYAEQLIMYVMSVASPTFATNEEMINDITRKTKDYKGTRNICYSFFGALFTYQFSHGFIDFRGRADKNNFDWFENSVRATLASREFCISNSDKSKTYSRDSWGLTPCVNFDGYRSFGAEPCESEPEHTGTIAPCGAIGSIVFTPEIVISAMKNYEKNPKLWGKYGFIDAYNLDKDWYSQEYIGIDKGISLVMIENYLTGDIWRYFGQNKYMKMGIEKLFPLKKIIE